MLTAAQSRVKVGADMLFTKQHVDKLRNRNIGIITNHTAIDGSMRSTMDLLKDHSKSLNYNLKAIFAPEHGLFGSGYASEEIHHEINADGIHVYSLHGKTRRPTKEMLSGIDLLIYDIQDVGSRSYTYATTLYYVMEEAARYHIPVIVLDRPNPMNGLTIDGTMLDDALRSMVGYINVPYCHGMTIGELARYFNSEYQVGCKLSVIPMEGWCRSMTFGETGLPWIPTSPQIPEAETAFYYPMTGIIGQLSLVNIGVGYTLPFKLIGAPWINASQLAQTLNSQNFPGVHFEPFHYRPFYGKFAQEDCHGVLIFITDWQSVKPVATQYLILGILKNLYPQKFQESLEMSSGKREMFDKVNGTARVYEIMSREKYIAWNLLALDEKERQLFKQKRAKYLIYK
jgi:uncharacterized protein YbbC (DUF1343 family)